MLKRNHATCKQKKRVFHMRKIALVLVVLAVAAVGQRVWVSTAAQNSGPFAEFDIDLTSNPQTDKSLESVTAKITGLPTEAEARSYLESIGFECRIDPSKSKNMPDSGRKFSFDSILVCGYEYGFFGEEIVVWVYLDENKNSVKVDTRNLYTEI